MAFNSESAELGAIREYESAFCKELAEAKEEIDRLSHEYNDLAKATQCA